MAIITPSEKLGRFVTLFVSRSRMSSGTPTGATKPIRGIISSTGWFSSLKDGTLARPVHCDTIPANEPITISKAFAAISFEQFVSINPVWFSYFVGLMS
jgi:hypothetical protein